MSKIIYLCHNDLSNVNVSKGDLEKVAIRIIPDNFMGRDTEIFESEGILYGIINPSPTNKVKGASVLLGQILGENESWDTPGTPVPDGSFAIFRANESTVELVTDVVASRTIWYFKNEKVFIASASQRAIVMLLQSFEFNPDVVPWMMSTGSLGPDNSWDKRIKMVPPDSIVNLNRNTWETSITCKPMEFLSDCLSERYHYDSLIGSLTHTFRSLNLDLDKWILSLSGGYDSRSILCFFNAIGKDIKSLNTFTLGLKQSILDKENDATIAKKIAKHFNISNTYFPTDLVGDTEQIMSRFLICGEGRIDHLSAYMDGFEIWKTLFKNNFEGIIKGDESLGWVSVFTDRQLRARVGIGMCTDYSNLKNYKTLGYVDQELPSHLLRKREESLAQWRDRLCQQFRIPVIKAALTDLKLSYVEVVNPLLSRNVIYTSRRIPDRLRHNKSLFKKIVNSISPRIPYARTSAIAKRNQLLRASALVELFKKELCSSEANALFPEEFLETILNGISSGKASSANVLILKRFLFKFLPDKTLIHLVKRAPELALDNHILAFRIYLVCKMKRMLEEDALIFKCPPIN